MKMVKTFLHFLLETVRKRLNAVPSFLYTVILGSPSTVILSEAKNLRDSSSSQLRGLLRMTLINDVLSDILIFGF